MRVRPSDRTAGSRAFGLPAGAWIPALLLLLAGVLPVPAAGQGVARAGLSVERIMGSSDFAGETFTGRWTEDGRGFTRIELDSAGRTELWREDARRGRRRRFVSARELVPPGASRPLEIEGYQISPDGHHLLLFANSQRVWRERTKGLYYLFDLRTRTLRPLSPKPGWQMFAKFSPDGRRVAFVRDHDLFVTDVSGGRERRLTDSGSESIVNGTTDWVYEEELGLRDAFRWSPDGRRIAYWRFDRSSIPRYYIADQSTLYPTIDTIYYPKAGEPNSRVRVGSLELATGRTTWLHTGGDGDTYLPRMDWIDGSHVYVERLNRHQDRLELLAADVTDGSTRVILTDTDSAWVPVESGFPRWIHDGRQFLWMSDRGGFDQLYLYDRDGRLVRRLTGDYDVTSLDGVDESAGRVFFTAAHDGPLTRSAWWVSLDGGEPRLLAGGGGMHDVSISPNGELFVDEHSSAGVPPTWTLRRTAGGRIRTLVDNHELRARLDSLGFRKPEFTSLQAADGTSLNAYLVKPPDFDPSRRYGLLLYVYGGPGSQTVLDRWGGASYVWQQMLARRGILVASVDNRGTGGRGRDFMKQVYLHLGKLEVADQLAAAHQLADLPYVDGSRVGIWGWSYGGYMALFTALRSQGFLAAAVAVAPVTDWHFYDTIYTERYMRTPAENREGYRESAPVNFADDLAVPLLIVHGTTDDNVHFQNTLRMAGALEQAGKQFAMRVYPGKRHGIEGRDSRVNLYGMITGFLAEHLAPAPASAAMGR